MISLSIAGAAAVLAASAFAGPAGLQSITLRVDGALFGDGLVAEGPGTVTASGWLDDGSTQPITTKLVAYEVAAGALGDYVEEAQAYGEQTSGVSSRENVVSTFAMAPGERTVCVYGLSRAGAQKGLGCFDVSLASVAATPVVARSTVVQPGVPWGPKHPVGPPADNTPGCGTCW